MYINNNIQIKIFQISFCHEKTFQNGLASRGIVGDRMKTSVFPNVIILGGTSRVQDVYSAFQISPRWLDKQL